MSRRIADSLIAEYEDVELDATWTAVFGSVGIEYAQVTVEGWQSRSWVEVLGELRPDHFDFGAYKSDATGHGLPRMSGYEDNWSVPCSRNLARKLVACSLAASLVLWKCRSRFPVSLSEAGTLTIQPDGVFLYRNCGFRGMI